MFKLRDKLVDKLQPATGVRCSIMPDQHGWTVNQMATTHLDGYSFIVGEERLIGPCAIGNFDLIVAVNNVNIDKIGNGQYNGLLAYNLLNNTWRVWSTYCSSHLSVRKVAFNPVTNEVYLLCDHREEHKIYLVGVDSKTKDHIVHCSQKWKVKDPQNEEEHYCDILCEELIVAGNWLHCVFNRYLVGKTVHAAWNWSEKDAPKEFVTVCDVDLDLTSNFNSFVHLENQNKLLLLQNRQRDVFELDLNDFETTLKNHDQSSFETYWTKHPSYDLPEKLSQYSHVLMENEKYLLLLHGVKYSQWVSDMYVLNLQTSKWNQVKQASTLPVSVPLKRFSYAGTPSTLVKNTDEEKELTMIVQGFARELEPHVRFPKDLVQIVSRMCCMSHIHLMHYFGENDSYASYALRNEKLHWYHCIVLADNILESCM